MAWNEMPVLVLFALISKPMATESNRNAFYYPHVFYVKRSIFHIRSTNQLTYVTGHVSGSGQDERRARGELAGLQAYPYYPIVQASWEAALSLGNRRQPG